MTFLLNLQNAFEYIIELGLCTQESQSEIQIELKTAKNVNLVLTLPEGDQFLIKQKRHNKIGKTAGTLLREYQIQRLLQRLPDFSDITPSICKAIYYDDENSVMIFNYLQGYCELNEFYIKKNIFPIEIATRIGHIVASIHRPTLNRQDVRDLLQGHNDTPSQPTLELTNSIKQITPEVFGCFGADGLEFLSLYQRYDSLGQAIANLSTAIKPCCLIHNDLKLKNILLSPNGEKEISNKSQSAKSMIRLIDWENSTWGDPASDLGTLIASYLQIYLFNSATSNTIALFDSLRALTAAYLSYFPEILQHRPDFLLRVVQFSGLGLVQLILTRLQEQKSFGNQGVFMLQTAKSLLCNPEQSIETIFGAKTKRSLAV